MKIPKEATPRSKIPKRSKTDPNAAGNIRNGRLANR